MMFGPRLTGSEGRVFQAVLPQSGGAEKRAGGGSEVRGFLFKWKK